MSRAAKIGRRVGLAVYWVLLVYIIVAGVTSVAIQVFSNPAEP